MNTRVLLTALFAIFMWNLGFAQNKTKKTIFIIVDGIAPDMLEKTEIPNLKRIAKEGFLKKAYVGGRKGDYSESPTISAVGYNTVLTGTWANKHNVFGNGIEDPNYKYPTIFRLFEDQFPEKTTAVFSTWLDNRTKLVGDGLAATDNIKIDIHFDGYENDTINFPHDKHALYLKKIDSVVAERASETVRKQAPDLSWVYLEHTDDIGHRYGDSPELYKIISYEDRLIGKIYDAVKFREKNFNEEWLFVVTTDHGRTEKDGKHHGGQSARERATWVVMNQPNPNLYTKTTDMVAAVDILPTIVDFLNISVPEKYQKELDGSSLLSPVYAHNMKASISGNRLSVAWDTYAPGNRTGEIFITNSNNFRTGGEDQYTSLGKVKLSAKKFNKELKLPLSDHYKILLKNNGTYINTWIKNTTK